MEIFEEGSGALTSGRGSDWAYLRKRSHSHRSPTNDPRHSQGTTCPHDRRLRPRILALSRHRSLSIQDCPVPEKDSSKRHAFGNLVLRTLRKLVLTHRSEIQALHRFRYPAPRLRAHAAYSPRSLTVMLEPPRYAAADEHHYVPHNHQ